MDDINIVYSISNMIIYFLNCSTNLYSYCPLPTCNVLVDIAHKIYTALSSFNIFLDVKEKTLRNTLSY